MARTAPVPNIPAIPGMNPGVWVMGGGGDGGGGSGGSGKGGAGQQGANGQNGGNGAGPDGRGAGSCGPGSGGGCPNPSHGGNGGTTAGDPVDVMTGRVFTRPVVDLALPGPLPLVIQRFYSSYAHDRDIGLGFGWSHSLAWEIEVRRRTLRLWKEDGRYEDIDQPEKGGQVLVAGHWLHRSPEELVLVDATRRERVFREVVAGSGRWLLRAIRDAYGNTIELAHDASGTLTGLTDSVGRHIRFVRAPTGRISGIEALNAEAQGRWVRFAGYLHDEAGDLVKATDARGHDTRYTYAEHLLTTVTSPCGRVVHHLYDGRRRCVETWVDQGGALDPSLDASVPDMLADGRTRARGVLHVAILYDDGYVEVATSREVRRYESNEMGKCKKAVLAGGVSENEFDDHGFLIGHSDPMGAVWSWKRDALSRPTAEIDPLGGVFTFTYDERGRLATRSDPLGRTFAYTYNAQGDVTALKDDLGPIIEHAYDARGLWIQSTLPDGSITQMSYDAHGNRVGIVEPNGGARSFQYDFFGRRVATTDEGGHTTRFQYDAAGNVTAVIYANGTQYTFEIDGDGRVHRLRTPAGRTTELFWSGYEAVHELRRPDGSKTRYRYDREGDLVRVVNEVGEEYVITRDPGGRVVAERTFDGRSLRFKVDLLGRITQVVHPSGGRTDLEYDALGHVVKRVFDEELTEEFSYDLLGRLVEAKDGATTCTFDFDPRSQLVRETQVVGGETHVVESRFDASGRRIGARTSLGHEHRVAYDRVGMPVEVGLDAGPPVRFAWGLTGMEKERLLPGGARMRMRYDAVDALDRRQLFAPVAGPVVGAQEPEWIGDLPGLVLDEGFTRDADGLVTAQWVKGRGTVDYGFDAVGRILSRVPDPARRELFGWGAADELFDGRQRVYEAGGMLVKTATATYRYDANHRLIEKQVGSAGGLETWRYEWDARGLLAAVVKPDGTRIELIHDALARLLARRVLAPGKKLVRAQRFVWDQDALVHEIARRLDRPDDPVVEERTYAWVPGSLAPLAHRDIARRKSGDEASPWVYYWNDATHRAEALVSGDGKVLARLEGEVWGRVAYAPGAQETTQLRFAQQREDEDTGLFYNRYRHYDPETGRYLSPEPLGLGGGMRPFGYVEGDPLHMVDPDGLVGMWATARGGGRRSTRGSATTERPATTGADENGRLHPAVQRALLPRERAIEPDVWNNDVRHPAACAEPRAVSDYLRARGVPDDASPDEIRAALADMRIRAYQDDDRTRTRAPCRNCSQFFANMMELYGAPHPDQIAAGYRSARGGQPTSFSPPPAGEGYHESYDAARAAYQARTGRAPVAAPRR